MFFFNFFIFLYLTSSRLDSFKGFQIVILLNHPLLLSASKPYNGVLEGHKEGKKKPSKSFQVMICYNRVLCLLQNILTPDCGWNSARKTFQGRILSQFQRGLTGRFSLLSLRRNKILQTSNIAEIGKYKL